MGMFYWMILGFIPKEEDRYNFTFDGEVHENITFTPFEPYEGFVIYYIGNMSFVGSDYEDTGENYFCYIADSGEGYAAAYCMSTAGDHTVSLELASLPAVETVHKLDNKYVDAPYTIEDNGDVVFKKDIYSNNINALQNTVGAPLSNRLYEHFGVDKNDYPYVYITLDENKYGKLYFTMSQPGVGTGGENGDSYYIYSRYYVVEATISEYYNFDLENVIMTFCWLDPTIMTSGEELYSMPCSKYNYITYPYSSDWFKDSINIWKIFDENTIIEDIYKLKSGGLGSVQPDYNQNDPTAKDYIKNRPFYVEEKTIDPVVQTIYDSINSNSPDVSYDTTNSTYIGTIETDGTFKKYIINKSQVTINQEILVPGAKSTSRYYITRTGSAVCDEDIIYVGNLYLFTQNSADNTNEDYLFYYNDATNQLSLYFSSLATCANGNALSTYSSNLSNVDLSISVSTDYEIIYHKIDPNFLDTPYTLKGDNTKFAGTVTAKDFLVEKEVDGEIVTEGIAEVIANSSIQPDFSQEDTTAKDYIKNKPRIGQNHIILTDTANDMDYVICMTNGNLISYRAPDSIEVTTPPIKTDYMTGEVFDPTGMVLTAYYDDGTSEVINSYTYSKEPLTTYGNVEFTISAYPQETTVTISVIYLDDFEYTDNGDGTYTLTAWNETLNGESSTEMIVPDSDSIKI